MRVSIVCSCLLVFIIGVVGHSYAAESLDLTQAINYAMAQNRTLILSASSVKSSELGIVGAKSEFRFSVRPNVTAALNSGPGNQTSVLGFTVSKKLETGTELSTRIETERFDFVDDDEERFVVELSQPLFRNAGRLIHTESLKRANSSWMAARRRFELQKLDLVINVVRSYEQINLFKKQITADEQSYQRADALFRSTKAKEALGRTNRVDTLRVELQRGQALSRLETDRERLITAQLEFAELLGFEPDTVFDLKPTAELQINVPGAEEAVRIALQNRLDYAQQLQDYVDAKRNVKIARRGLFPDVRLIARYTKVSNGLIAFGDAGEKDRWFLGITGDTDFNQVRERNILDQARIDSDSERQTVTLTELLIARQIQQVLSAYRRAQGEYKIAQRNFDHALSRQTLARRLFELGRGSNFSVTDAEDAFLQSETQLLGARSAALVSSYELLRSMNTLTEFNDDLKPTAIGGMVQ